jgi:hypothetical protein
VVEAFPESCQLDSKTIAIGGPKPPLQRARTHQKRHLSDGLSQDFGPKLKKFKFFEMSGFRIFRKG